MNKLISSDLLSILSYTTRVYFSYASSILVYRRGEGGGKEIEEYLNISRFPKVVVDEMSKEGNKAPWMLLINLYK